jgi:hypothetical protein
MEEVLMRTKPAWPEQDKRYVPWRKALPGGVRFTVKQV